MNEKEVEKQILEVERWVKDIFSPLGARVSFYKDNTAYTFIVWGSKKSDEKKRGMKNYRHPEFYCSFKMSVATDINMVYRIAFAGVIYGLYDYDFSDIVEYAHPIRATSRLIIGVELYFRGDKGVKVMLKDKDSVSISIDGGEEIVVSPTEFMDALRKVRDTLLV